MHDAMCPGYPQSAATRLVVAAGSVRMVGMVRCPMLAAILALVPLALLAAPAAGQGLDVPAVAYPPIAPVAGTAFDFVPEGWALEKIVWGDLDNDGREDFAGVLKMRDPANVVANRFLGEDPFDTNPRILLVALRLDADHFRTVLADHMLIPRRETPAQDDPFNDLSIERGVLRVELENFMSAGGWTTWRATYAFRWQDPHFVLIGYDRNELARNTGESEDISINYLTRRRKTVTGQMDDARQSVAWSIEPRRPPVTLEAIGNGLEWHPDQESGTVGQ